MKQLPTKRTLFADIDFGLPKGETLTIDTPDDDITLRDAIETILNWNTGADVKSFDYDVSADGSYVTITNIEWW